MNLYQHEKNKAISSFCFRDTFDLKTLQPDWLVKLWLISQEPDFFQRWVLCSNISNNKNFYYSPNLGNVHDKNFQYIQKTLLYTNVWGKIFFNKYQALSHTTLYGFLALFKNLENSNNTILRKCSDKWTDGRMGMKIDG